VMLFHFKKIFLGENVCTRGPFFDPEKCLKELILTCLENSILVHFSIVPISVRILASNPNWTKIGSSDDWKADQNRIFKAIT